MSAPGWGLPECKWPTGGRRWLFGWLFAKGDHDAIVIDVRHRVHKVPSSSVERRP